jgi:hypothetical protein
MLEVPVIRRSVSVSLLLSCLSIFSVAGTDKPKSKLPEQVVHARTVLVVIPPDAMEPQDNPRANETARDNVEKSLQQWGRFQLVQDGQPADLVVSLRIGNKINDSKVKAGPIDVSPGVAESSDGRIRGGVQPRPGPPLEDPNEERAPSTGPRIVDKPGPPPDVFEVYLGSGEYPLDSPPVWRYVAVQGLRAPKMTAVEQFRKAIAKSEKAQPKKTP